MSPLARYLAVRASDDPRGAKVEAYNAAVRDWTVGGAAAAWKADQQALDVRRLVLLDATTTSHQFVFNLTKIDDTSWSSMDEYYAMFSKWGVAEYARDLSKYDQGLVWSATAADYHVRGQQSAGAVTARLDGKTTAVVEALPAFACDYKRTVERCDTSQWSDGSCERVEFVSANRRWLSGMNLVAAEDVDAGATADECAYTFESVARSWRTADNAANDDAAENAAKALCEDKAPPDQNIDLKVVLRSPRDPFVVAGRVTGRGFSLMRSSTRVCLTGRRMYTWLKTVCALWRCRQKRGIRVVIKKHRCV